VRTGRQVTGGPTNIKIAGVIRKVTAIPGHIPGIPGQGAGLAVLHPLTADAATILRVTRDIAAVQEAGVIIPVPDRIAGDRIQDPIHPVPGQEDPGAADEAVALPEEPRDKPIINSLNHEENFLPHSPFCVLPVLWAK